MTLPRLKTYASDTGRVYEYYFVEKRPALTFCGAAVEYVYDVSSDRQRSVFCGEHLRVGRGGGGLGCSVTGVHSTTANAMPQRGWRCSGLLMKLKTCSTLAITVTPSVRAFGSAARKCKLMPAEAGGAAGACWIFSLGGPVESPLARLRSPMTDFVRSSGTAQVARRRYMWRRFPARSSTIVCDENHRIVVILSLRPPRPVCIIKA